MIIARLNKVHKVNNKPFEIEYNSYQTGASTYKIVETFPNGNKKHYDFASFDSLNDTWEIIKNTNITLGGLI